MGTSLCVYRVENSLETVSLRRASITLQQTMQWSRKCLISALLLRNVLKFTFVAVWRPLFLRPSCSRFSLGPLSQLITSLCN